MNQNGDSYCLMDVSRKLIIPVWWLILFRETYDGISHVVWRVYDADKVDDILQKVIAEKDHPREFDYEMEYDEEWKLVEWYLQDFPKKNK